MSDFKLKNTCNLFPTSKLGIYAYYDHDYIRSFYSISQSETGQAFFNRHFIKVMCEALNEKTHQDYIRGLQMDVHFDKFESIIVCRFELPYAEALKKSAMVFLFDIVSNKDRRTWIEKVIFDNNYFVIFASTIN